MKKKALIISLSSVAVIIALIVTLFLTVPFGTCGNGTFWIIQGDKLTVFGKGEASTHSENGIPWNEHIEKITEVTLKNGVTSISGGLFSSHLSLKNVYISESVEDIEVLAFSNCTSLELFAVDEKNEQYSSDENGVLFDKDKNTLLCYPAAKKETSYTIPESVVNISISAFENAANLTLINFPDKLKSIDNHAFSSCTGLREVVLPDGLTTLGTQSFFDCRSLEKITIPGSVTNVGMASFSLCDVLDEIDFVGTFEQWEKLLVETNSNWILTPTVRFILDYGKCGENASFVITRERELIIWGNGSVDDSGWSDNASKILSVTVCEGIAEIGEYTFSGLSRVEVLTVPNSVENIGNFAFDGFTKEQTIKIDNTDAFVSENFSPDWDTNCEANILFK